MKTTHQLAAAAILRYLWQPKRPPSTDGRPWTMGRELRIFDQLNRHVDALVLLGAIEHVRAVTGTRGPARMTWLIHPQRGNALLSRAVAAFHAAQSAHAPPGPSRGGSLARISVELPPPFHEDAP